MLYELHNSGIATGFLNCYCLPCDTFLEEKREAFCHIRTSSHCENLNAVPYLNKYKDQYIRKFKAGYFCEFCNHLIHTAIKVDLHIAEDRHIQNRGTKLLRYLHRDVIAFKSILIKEHAWHGLIDNNICCICDAEFEDEDHHKTDTTHVMKLIQNPVKFGTNDVIYRHIDDTTVQCLTCNNILPLHTIIEHFETSDHLDFYTKSKIMEQNETEATIEKDNKENITDITSTGDDDCNSRINFHINNSKTTQHVATHQGIDIDYETATAVCKTCHTETKIDLDNIEKLLKLKGSNLAAAQYADSGDEYYSTSSDNNDFNKKHINDNLIEDPQVILCEDEPRKEQLVASSKLKKNDDTSTNTEDVSTSSDAIIKEHDFTDAYHFAKENDIVYNPKSSTAFCQICKVKLPFNLKSMNEHVKGVPHNKKIAATKEKRSNCLTKQTMIEFVTSMLRTKSTGHECPFDSGYLINGKYYLSSLSFLLLARSPSNLRCLLCGTSLPVSRFPTVHIDTCCLPLGQNFKFITSKPDEFIREIREEVFHCGFCHTMILGWSEMEKHLRTAAHDIEKTYSYQRFDKINSTMFAIALPMPM